MSVVGAACALSTTCTTDAEYHRTYTSIYRVRVNNPYDSPLTVYTAANLPTFMSEYVWGNDVDMWAFANNAVAALEDVHKSRLIWLVTVTHSTKPHQRNDQNRRENPLDEPPVISGSFQQHTKHTDKDRKGNALVNAVGEKFLPAPTVDDPYDSLLIEKNSKNISLEMRSEFRAKVNSNTQWGLKPRQIKLVRWDFKVMHFGLANAYIHNTFEFHINEDKWNYQPLSCGFQWKSGVDVVNGVQVPHLVRFESGNDHPTNQPQLITKDTGFPLIVGIDPPEYHDFEVLDEKDFSELPLPDPLPGPFV